MLAAIGKLFNTGRYDMTRKIAVTGPKAIDPSYVTGLPGMAVADLKEFYDNSAEELRFISGDVLTVQAERHSEHEDKDQKNKYVRCERSYGLYSRQFDVSEIDTENIKAKYENGVLKLTLPKKSEVSSSPKRVEIE